MVEGPVSVRSEINYERKPSSLSEDCSPIHSWLRFVQSPEGDLSLYRQILAAIRDEEKYRRILEHDKAEIQVLLDFFHYVSQD